MFQPIRMELLINIGCKIEIVLKSPLQRQDKVSPDFGIHMFHFRKRYTEENMNSSHFSARRYWGWIMAGAIILASCIGCKNLGGSANSGAGKVTVLDPRGQPSGIFGRVGAAGAGMLANRNPDTQPKMYRDELVPLRMAPRLHSLDNKTIYLVDTGFAGGKDFLEELQAWFGKNMPSVKTVLRIKSGNAFSDSPELWVELKKKADGVVFGVGG
jgi:hypothetical protein